VTGLQAQLQAFLRDNVGQLTSDRASGPTSSVSADNVGQLTSDRASGRTSNVSAADLQQRTHRATSDLGGISAIELHVDLQTFFAANFQETLIW
jgi:hypothetical protein